MSGTPAVREYKNLSTLVTRLRSDIVDIDCILLYAYNRTGKTRLSMAFKDRGKKKNSGKPDTLYFNAYTEDLFTWENDLENDVARYIKINAGSVFFNGLKDLALDETVAGYLSRYADLDFDIDYDAWTVTFRNAVETNIKISRGEQNIFIWCLFMAICERVIDGHESYNWVRFLSIDDPISSLDDDNAIAVACDLASLLRKAMTRRRPDGEPNPIKVLFSSHHSLFFNVMCNELGRTPEGREKVKIRRYFLHRPSQQGVFTLRATGDTPYFHHVATLAELQNAVQTGKLYTHHFNALRSILEKIASFFGHEDLKFCLRGLHDEALYNRALNLLSHGRYSVYEPVEMIHDNQELFERILNDILVRFQFALPAVLAADVIEEEATQ